MTLTVSQIPLHTHSVNDVGHNHAVNDPGHAHRINDPGHNHNYRADNYGNQRGIGAADNDNGDAWQTSTSLTGIGIYGSNTGIWLNPATSGISINSQGGGGSHDNMPPALVCNYIIKI